MYVHSTSNRYKVGDINITDYKLEEHKLKLEDKNVDEVAVIFENSDNKNPKLILLNEKPNYGHNSTTYGYYYKSKDAPSIKYTFKYVASGVYLMESLVSGDSYYQDDMDHNLNDIKDTLNQITTIPMTSNSEQQESYYTECKEEFDPETKIEECLGTKREKPSQDPVESNTVVRGPPVPAINETQQDSGGRTVQPDTQKSSVSTSLSSQEESFGSSTPIQPQSPPTPQDASTEGRQEVEQEAHTDGESSSQTSDSGDAGPKAPPAEVSPEPSQIETEETDGDFQRNEEMRHSGTTFDRSDLQTEHAVEEGTLDNRMNGRVDTSINRNGSSGISNNLHPDENSNEKGVGEKIKEFFEENKGPIYGGGGSIATAAGSAYPLYKVVSKFIH